jgi:hypothetical protein
MSYLGATLPVTQGVAVYAALNAAAASATAVGDGRSRGQVMADTLVERVTGQERAELVPLRVDLIITDQALTDTGAQANEPATVSGYGPMPAPVARDIIARTATGGQSSRTEGSPGQVSPGGGSSGEAAAQGLVALRRLFTDPAGRLVSMETQNRFFTSAMGEFVRLRDQRCTTPFCGAPIRNIDHLVSVANGGPTSLVNAGGLCESCNLAKEAPGWTVTRMPDGTITVTMPTGHDTATLTRPHAPTAAPLPEQPAAPPSAEPPSAPPPPDAVCLPRPRNHPDFGATSPRLASISFGCGPWHTRRRRRPAETGPAPSPGSR